MHINLYLGEKYNNCVHVAQTLFTATIYIYGYVQVGNTNDFKCIPSAHLL